MSKLRGSTLALGLVLLPLLGASAHAARTVPKVFIEAQASPENPYVQAATRVTVRLFSARALYHADLELPSSTDVQVQQVGSDDRETISRGGRTYDVLTREYLAFPQRSGKVSIAGAVLSAQVLMSAGRPNAFYHPGGSMGGSPYGYGAMISVQPLVVHGASIALHVRPRPAKAVASYWVPARSVTLTSKWDPPSLEAHVGDALSLDLVLEASDLTAEQLPDLTALLAVPQGLKAYPDGPKLADSDRGNTLVGRREQSIALIASEPGRFTLPALELKWWNTLSNRAEEVSLPARTITVLPNRPGAATAAAGPGGGSAATSAGGGAAAGGRAGAAGAPGSGAGAGAGASARAGAGAAGAASAGSGASAPASGASSGSAARASSHGWGNPWMWTTLGVALAWLCSAAAWLLARRRRASSSQAASGPSPSASKARSAFLAACRSDDPRAARRNLLAWVEAEWAAPAPTGLQGLARRIGEPRAEALLRELDRACYAGGEWHGEPLGATLMALPAGSRGERASRSPLGPLYR